MSMRGLIVALVCALLGIGGGALVAALVQPHPASGGEAAPLPGGSLSVPTYSPTSSPYRPDITYPALEPGLALNRRHVIKNHLATWTYHVPQGWAAYGFDNDVPIPPRKADTAKELRFKPPDEPSTGGFSLYVRILDNKIGINPETMVQGKVIGFRDYKYPDRQVIRRTRSSIYFTYRDPTTNYHRWNYFQWYAVSSGPNATATLQVSVAGRGADAKGLRALLNRYSDNLVGRARGQSAP